MDEKALMSFVSDNSILGATGVAALAFLYKIWRILQSDRKEDDLDSAERTFRNEMREEIKSLKEDRHQCEEEKNILYKQIFEFQKQLANFQAAFRLCHSSHPDTCPLLRRSSENQNDEHPPLV